MNPNNITWEKDSPRYAYPTDKGLGSFAIKANADPGLVNLPWHGGLTQYALYGDDLYIAGNPENASPGIWHYNLVKKSLDCITLEATERYHYAKKYRPLVG